MTGSIKSFLNIRHRFTSLELSLSVNLAHDILQDLLNVTDGGAQDSALADGVFASRGAVTTFRGTQPAVDLFFLASSNMIPDT